MAYPPQFLELVDRFIQLANQMAEERGDGEVSAAILFAAGRYNAFNFVSHGGQVTLFDVNDEKGHASAKELGDAARFFRTDVTSEDGVTTNVAAAHHAMGGLNAPSRQCPPAVH